MSLISDHVAEFSVQLGLEGRIDEPAEVSFDIEELGLLQMMERESALFVSLARRILLTDDRSRVLRRALASVHHDAGLPEAATAGLRGDLLVFTCRFNQHDVERSRLEAAVDMLVGLQDEARA